MAEGYVFVIYNVESKNLMFERGVFDTKGACKRVIDKQLKSFDVDLRKKFIPKKVALKDLLTSSSDQ